MEKQIYYQFASYMFTVCYRYIGNRESAEEVLNNGFLKVFKNYRSFENRGDNSLKYWIKKIMINECLMFLRQKKKIKFIEIDSIHENSFIENATDYSDIEIIHLLQKLPVGCKTVFNLFAIEGFSHQEIANQLGIKESTSRSQLTLARRLLKEHLNKMGYEYSG